jgi:hypothetical protein
MTSKNLLILYFCGVAFDFYVSSAHDAMSQCLIILNQYSCAFCSRNTYTCVGAHRLTSLISFIPISPSAYSSFDVFILIKLVAGSTLLVEAGLL